MIPMTGNASPIVSVVADLPQPRERWPKERRSLTPNQRWLRRGLPLFAGHCLLLLPSLVSRNGAKHRHPTHSNPGRKRYATPADRAHTSAATKQGWEDAGTEVLAAAGRAYRRDR